MKSASYSLGLLVLIMFLFTSCNKGSDSSGPVKTQDELLHEAKSATDHSETVKMNSFTMIKANLSSEEQKERYTLGCKTQGEPTGATAALDRSLAVGQVFKKQSAGSHVLEKDHASISEETITSVQPEKVLSEVNYEQLLFADTPFTNVNQIFSRKPHSKSETTYKADADGNQMTNHHSVELNLTPAAAEYLKTRLPSNASHLSCHIDYTPDVKSKDSVDKMFYNMNGKNVVAYLEKHSLEGEVVCVDYSQKEPGTKISLGKGHSENFVINSNDVVERDLMNCGGTELFRLSKVTLDSGKILNVFVDKVLYAPER